MSVIAIYLIFAGITFLFAWGLVAGGAEPRKEDA